jgi:prepilin-type N-terminal cleavage/methylation domain-containing protein
MRKEKGFSLIELLIVVAIILIIAAIAVPNLLRARVAANESSAVASVRTINSAMASYQTANPSVGYAAALSNLGPQAATGCTGPTSTNACLVDWTLANGNKSGYDFSAVNNGATPATAYTVGAAPATYNNTGVRLFCSVEDAVIHADPNASKAAGASGASGITAANCNGYTVLQ